MKIKHAVIISMDEVNALADILTNACLKSYTSQEEQAIAVGIARAEFETLLNRYTQQAFKLGKKLAKKLKEDTGMATPVDTTIPAPSATP